MRAVELDRNPRVVHHAIMGVDQTRSSARRDAQDAEPGFEGMDLGDAQPPDGHLAGWTPGMAPVPAVEGSAWRLEPGDDLVLQLHMTPSGKPESVQPQIGLHFAKAPPTGPSMVLLRLDADHQLDIPAGVPDFVVTDRFELPADVHVLAVYPHAHFLARTMEAHATLPDGREQPLIRIDAWDFKWQDVYRYAQPLRLPKGTAISFRYTYDNSAGNPRNPSRPPKRVVAGMRSTDEMARLQLQVRPDRVEDVATLRTAFYLQLARKAPDDPWVHYELANLLRDSRRRDDAVREYRRAIDLDPRHSAALTNLGVILHEDGRIDEAVNYYQRALSAEPDFVPAHFNLANALRSGGQNDVAIRHYREAVRLEPALGAAHNNLGEILASQGHMDLALGSFREAVRLSPRSPTALANLGAALGVMGRMEEAAAHLRQALEIDPGNETARRNLELALGR
jgi:tetratricopeptide (TPR) repeat protein